MSTPPSGAVELPRDKWPQLGHLVKVYYVKDEDKKKLKSGLALCVYGDSDSQYMTVLSFNGQNTWITKLETVKRLWYVPPSQLFVPRADFDSLQRDMRHNFVEIAKELDKRK